MSNLAMAPRRPGGRMAKRPLHFIWMVDCSGSMRLDGKAEVLNRAFHEAIPCMQAVAREIPQAAVFVNAIHFADDARWLEEKLTPVSEFHWQDIKTGGATALGEALTMVGNVLQPPLITDRALPPILALVTDGMPTDDFDAGLDHLLSKPWARQARRLVVAIGEDSASSDSTAIFESFLGNDALPPISVRNPDTLMETIRWISTALLESVSSPIIRSGDLKNGLAGTAVHIAPPPFDDGSSDEVPVW